MDTWSKKYLMWPGISLMIIGLSGILYYYLIHFRGNTDKWEVEVKGSETITEKEIKDVVLYLIRTDAKGITVEELEDSLEMNPRIDKAEIQVRPGKKLYIVVKERQTTHLVHTGSKLSEMSNKLPIQEKLVELPDYISSDMPIFYLTDRQTKKKDTQSVLSDIIRYWQSTRSDYAFLWERLSEIEIITRELRGPLIQVYPATTRARISITETFDDSVLQRLWAVLFFLEKAADPHWYDVELYRQNAIIKEVM